MTSAPLPAKTTTFAASSAVLAKLPARDAGWLRQAAATQATTATDRVRWPSACSQGLKPLAVAQQQFTALHAAEAATYAGLAADQQTTLAIDRIGSLATQEPRMDDWATCYGVGVGASPTRVLDGTYGVTVTRAEVIASGDSADCGNAGSYRLAVHDGRCALYHPAALNNNPDEPSMSFFRDGARMTRPRSGPSQSPATGRRWYQRSTSRTDPRRRPTGSTCSAACSPGVRCQGSAWTLLALGGG
jgi:hypothetical protein